jgi:hypothetical protein
MLGQPGASPIQHSTGGAVENSDDSPTIITRAHQQPPTPTSLPVSGDVPSIAGRRLGHFELIEAIGAGGMAAVLKARDLELGRVVALKILPPEAARDPEGVGRFKQEARAAALLDHENIARVYFCGEDQGLQFIAFEFVEGENLRQLIDRHGTLSPSECVRYMIQVAAGLSHANERGVVHRDIKPSNIIITPDGRAKIVDMGLARHLDAVNGGVTHSGVTLGTFDYISPEQALDPRRADVRSDIYSLGCAFYHALTGRPPVPDGTAAKKLHAHQHIDPLDPRAINPAIPDDVAAVLSGMMAKNPADRYQSPAGLIAHLKAIAERLNLPLGAVARDSAVQAVPATPALPTEPPRLRLAWVIAAAAIVIAVAAIAFFPPNQSPATRPSWAADERNKAADPPAGSAASGLQVNEQAAQGVVGVSTARGLAEALADSEVKRVHLEAGTYDLRELAAGVSYIGKEIHLVGSPTDVTKIILQGGYDSTPSGATTPGRLSIRAANLTAERIRFEILPPPFQEIPDDLFGFGGWPSQSVGLAIQSASQVQFVDCVFVNSCAEYDEAVSVAIAASQESSPVLVRIERCLFGPGKAGLRGGVALKVPPRSRVSIEDSGFGPHGAAIQIPAAADEAPSPLPMPPARVALARTSFMLESASVGVAALSPADVTAGYCVFSSVGSDFSALPPVLQVNRSEGLKFSGLPGQKNVYHQVSALMVGSGDAAITYTLDECRKKQLPVADSGAVNVAQRPWKSAEPLELLAGVEPWLAFALDPLDPALSVQDRGVAIVGAQFHPPGTTTRRAYASVAWPPANLTKPPSTIDIRPAARQLVWYPNPDAGDLPLPRDTYTEIEPLLKVAQHGDTILIRHTGLLHFKKAIELERPRKSTGDFKLTFKPFDGSKPILTAEEEGNRLDQSLFKLLSGEVAFEGVQFLLKPSRPRNPQTAVAVAIGGGKACSFSNCVFTLQEEDESRAAAVLITDPNAVMVMEGPERFVPTPLVRFDRCVVRGKGRGIWVPVSRAVRVEILHSLSAIDGPLYLGEAGGKSNVPARSSLTLSHVTAFVGGPLVELRGPEKATAMGTSGLASIDTEMSSSLLAGVPGAGQPLVELNGIDTTETTALLPWKAQLGNRYVNFDSSAIAMIVRPGGEAAVPREWNLDRWLSFAGEPAGNPVGSARFERGPTSLRDLVSIKPADLTVLPDLLDPKPGDTGVDPKALPEPWEDD